MGMSSGFHQTVGLLIIGNEILSGRTRDANAWLASQALFKRGCRVQEVAVVPDQQAMIVTTLQRLSQHYDAVITSGGIGPTHDDITMACVAEAWGVPLQEYDEVMQLMRQRYGEQALNEGRRRMARLPAGSEMIICAASIAPGAKLHNVYVLAGVPHIFASQLDAILHDFGDRPFLRQEIEVNLAESVFAAALGALQKSHPQVEIGSYPARCGNTPSGKICLTSQSDDALSAARQAIETMLESL